MLKNILEGHYEVYETKQPTNFYRGYDRFRKYVDGDLEMEPQIQPELALLSAADKLRHYNIELKNNMDKVILCDRYIYSAYAYFYARGLRDIEWLKQINKNVIMPDFTFYLDVSPEDALQRIIIRDGKSRKKEETVIKLMNDVRKCFLNQVWGNHHNYYVINADRNPISINEEIMELMSKNNDFKL